MAHKNYILSKSSFVKGNQSTKALHLNAYHKELKEELSGSQESIFLQGTKVGLLAQGLFPNGVNLKPQNYSDTNKHFLNLHNMKLCHVCLQWLLLFLTMHNSILRLL